MISDLFSILNSNSTVKSYLGTNPLRVFPYGRAPEDVARPYAVYTVFNASPENYIDRTPDIDSISVQVSIYATTEQSLLNCFTSVRNAIEPYAHMTNFATPDIDADDELYSCRMEFDFWDAR
jgi:hypothetical protein